MLNVMEIERFAVHDGPGIRTTVFLKGCALRCPWCANPESQSVTPQMLYDAAKCVHCSACVAACSTGAATWQGANVLQDALSPALAQPASKQLQTQGPVFNAAVCTACGACARACMQDALTLCGTRITAQAIAEVCLRDKHYYDASGGGVTLSGGEAMLAGEALVPLLVLLREQGFSVAVETCGQFSSAVLPRLLPYFDLFLFDVKHADAQRLRAVTGGDAALIAQNLAAIVASGKPVVARVPVIPGFNHTPEEMEAIFALCEANAIKTVNLLPYHTLGKSKYAKLGRAYLLDAPMVHKDELADYVPLAAAHGIVATLGG